MTSAPSLPAQIEPSRDVLIEWLRSFKAPHDTRYTKPLLVTLQQHERLEATLNYVADMTYCGADAEWHFKPGYDPQRVLDALAKENT